MAKTPKWSREEAISYLEHNRNAEHVRHTAPRGLPAWGDMSTAMLKRAASKFQLADVSGVPVRDWAQVRGHTFTEHHAGRGNKRGYEQAQTPEPFRAVREHRWKQGDYNLLVTATRGEATAVRALARAAARGEQVSLMVTGWDEKGNSLAIPMFWRGGWSARQLLDAAGYTLRIGKRKGGIAVSAHLRDRAPGLRNFLEDYGQATLGYPIKFIRVFEIFAHDRDQGKPGRHGPVDVPGGQYVPRGHRDFSVPIRPPRS